MLCSKYSSLLGRSLKVAKMFWLLKHEKAAKVVNRYCGSSMDALHQVSQSINAGDSLTGIAFGVEHMFDENNERFPGFGVPMMGYNPSLNPNLIER